MIWHLKRDTLIQRDQIVIKFKHLTPLSTYWIILTRYMNWEKENACLGRLQGGIRWQWTLWWITWCHLRFNFNTKKYFFSFVENEDVEAYIQSMRQDGKYGGEIEIKAFSMMLQISVWIYGQESLLDTHL